MQSASIRAGTRKPVFLSLTRVLFSDRLDCSTTNLFPMQIIHVDPTFSIFIKLDVVIENASDRALFGNVGNHGLAQRQVRKADNGSNATQLLAGSGSTIQYKKRRKWVNRACKSTRQSNFVLRQGFIALYQNNRPLEYGNIPTFLPVRLSLAGPMCN